MEVRPSSPRITLAATGQEIVNLLRKFRRIPTPQNDELASRWNVSIIETEIERFDLWSVNLGLFVQGHGSLDYRLRESERLQSTVGYLLEELKHSIQEGSMCQLSRLNR